MLKNTFRYSFLKCILLIFSGLILGSIESVVAQSTQNFTVVLDAGHGGKDPGKVSRGIREKDLALDIVLSVGRVLKKYKDIKVVYTRKKDVFVDLFVRGKIANKAQADLFVSVHCNAHNSSAFGAETFVLGLHTNRENFEVAKGENKVIYLEDNYQENYEGYDINSPESVIGIAISQEEFLRQSVALASYIQDKFSNKLKRHNRGVKQAGFIVLHQTFMPSVLIETGFITNRSERNYLKSQKGQEQLANSIANAILKYKKTFGFDKPKIVSHSEIYYKVQIMASAKNISLEPSNFNGLSDLSMDKSNKFYKYYYGKTTDYNRILNMKAKAKAKGYKDSYVVAYKGSKKISLTEAKKWLSD